MNTQSIRQLEAVLIAERVPARDRHRILARAKKPTIPTLESKGDCKISWNPQWEYLNAPCRFRCKAK